MKKRAIRPQGKLFGFSYQFNNGLSAYYFLLVDNIKEKILNRILAEDRPFRVTDYGSLVASGYGSPTEETKVMLREKYNAEI